MFSGVKTGKAGTAMMEKNRLLIRVVEARDLMAADLNGKSDPYVKIKDVPGLVGKGAKTQVIKKTLNPTWNEDFEFFFGYKTVCLRFKVFDYDRIGDHDEIGKAAFPIANLMDGQPKDVWLPLTVKRLGLKQQKGQLHLIIRAEWYIPLAIVGQWVPMMCPEMHLGLGWDFSKKKGPVDLDASVIALDYTNAVQATVSFSSKVAFGGAIKHSGDNRTGEGSGDDEVITVSIPRLPPNVTKIITIVNNYGGKSLQCAKSAYMRIFDATGTKAFFRPMAMPDTPGIFFGIFSKNAQGYWYFQSVAQPIRGNTVKNSMPDVLGILARFGF